MSDKSLDFSGIKATNFIPIKPIIALFVGALVIFLIVAITMRRASRATQQFAITILFATFFIGWLWWMFFK